MPPSHPHHSIAINTFKRRIMPISQENVERDTLTKLQPKTQSERQATYLEKIPAIHLSSKGHTSRIKSSSKSVRKRLTSQLEIGRATGTGTSHESISTWP